jgi:serine/threonine protein kinase
LRKKRSNPTASSSGIAESCFRVSYQDLLKATNGFSSENLIARGGFGCVYKGSIHDQNNAGGRNIVASKVVSLSNKGASRSFIAECEALKRIKHRNLVRVLTACASVDYRENDFKALVFEFMANGSLDDLLHPAPGGNDELHRRTTSLDFVQRLNIVIDVASALEYLHHLCGTPIVHCDLKPSNVLLDNDMIAHVGDFGLSKFLFKEIESSTSNESSSIGVRGTIGYAPPGLEIYIYILK